MADYLRHKIEQLFELSAEEKEIVSGLSQTNLRSIPARRDIIRGGDRPNFVNLLIDGWAIRHKTLVDGRRQIIAFLVPGDICDLNLMLIKEMDHSIAALTPATIAQLPGDLFFELAGHPRLVQALTWDLMVQAAIQREWIVSLGQRSALERIAHLICELFLRLRTIRLCVDDTCTIPITQNELAEAAGLTPVHVNRIIQELRANGLIEWTGRVVHIPDMEELMRIAMFNGNYLHLGADETEQSLAL